MKGEYILLVFVIIFFLSRKELYHPAQTEYRYGFIDTNPARRISSFFDGCSPENVGDCKLNNPYEGLPLP
jgi:hypothetical protein